MFPPPYRIPSVPPPPSFQPWNLTFPPPPPPTTTNLANHAKIQPHVMRLPAENNLLRQWQPSASTFSTPHPTMSEFQYTDTIKQSNSNQTFNSWTQYTVPNHSQSNSYSTIPSSSGHCKIWQQRPFSTHRVNRIFKKDAASKLRQSVFDYHRFAVPQILNAIQNTQQSWQQNTQQIKLTSPDSTTNLKKKTFPDIISEVTLQSQSDTHNVAETLDHSIDFVNQSLSDERKAFWLNRIQVRESFTEAQPLFENSPIIILKLSSLDFSPKSPLLVEFVKFFLPSWYTIISSVLNEKTKVIVANNMYFPTEVFLHQSRLESQSLNYIINGLRQNGLISTALHIAQNPSLGQEGVIVLANYVKESIAPLRWISFSKCNLSDYMYKPLFEAMLHRQDIYNREQATFSAPIWLDLGATDINLDDLYRYLSEIKSNLYCDASNRACCGINRCESKAAIFHIPKVIRICDTSFDAVQINECDRLSVVSSKDDDSDSEFSKILSDEDEDEKSQFVINIQQSSSPAKFEHSLLLNEKVDRVSYNTLQPSSNLQKKQIARTDNKQIANKVLNASKPDSVGPKSTKMPSTALINAPKDNEKQSTHKLLKSKVQRTELPSVTPLQCIYFAMLRQAFLEISMFAIHRDLFPADLIKDLIQMFKENLPVTSLIEPPLWKMQEPAALATHLLEVEEKQNSRKRPRCSDVLNAHNPSQKNSAHEFYDPTFPMSYDTDAEIETQNLPDNDSVDTFERDNIEIEDLTINESTNNQATNSNKPLNRGEIEEGEIVDSIISEAKTVK